MMSCRPAARLSPYRLLRLPLAGAVLVGSLVSGQDTSSNRAPDAIAPPPGISIKPFTAAPMLLVAEEPGWSPDQTPADFLEGIGRRVKARWRQLYRDAPPPPSTVRPASAFTLGSLMADSFLTLQALDAQQFRNNNQDVLNYCRVLGLSEKVAPRLMAQGKLAEEGNWEALRQEVVDGHQELCRVMHEQRDDDLAVLVDLGIWMRMLEMVSTVVAESGEPTSWPMAIGSPTLLIEMQTRFGKLSPPARLHERIVPLGELLGHLCRQWDNSEPPTAERVTKSQEKLASLMRKMTLK
jgi:hypothetical protein